jgi:GT2 family glycosyltransferase
MLPNLIVPVLNRYDLLHKMLESIDYPVRDLLIIDNGKKLGGNLTFKNQHVWSVNVLSMPYNLGVAASWNLGIKLFPHDDRWTFSSNDVVYQPGGLETLSKARESSLTLAQDAPHFHTFAVGEDVVKAVGLFDERFYPAYFEDNDYLRRCQLSGVPVVRLPVAATHANSSTLKSEPRYQRRNTETFARNRKLFDSKSAGDVMGWSWSLQSWRLGDWSR